MKFLACSLSVMLFILLFHHRDEAGVGVYNCIISVEPGGITSAMYYAEPATHRAIDDMCHREERPQVWRRCGVSFADKDGDIRLGFVADIDLMDFACKGREP